MSINGQPTISDLVPEYLRIGMTKRRAVHCIVELRMNRQNARGKGSAAGKRFRTMRLTQLNLKS